MLKNDLNGFGVCKGDEVSFSVTQSEKGARATDVKVKAALGKQEGAGAGGPLFFGEVRSFNQLKGRSPPPSAPREREERREERVGELRLGEALLASAEALASSRVQRPRACLERIASSSGPSSAFNSAQPAPNQVAYAEGWFDSESAVEAAVFVRVVGAFSDRNR